MTTHPLNLTAVHPSWKECLERGLAQIDPAYLETLSTSTNWLPGSQQIFNAFSLPLNQVNYVLFGESPYPRRESANGYAFWDAAVTDLWSSTGMSKQVNRATSLRNIIKMLLIADGLLTAEQCGQEDIARINKQSLIQSNNELFHHFLHHGFLLLNATPVLQDGAPQKDAKAWLPFTRELLNCLLHYRPRVKFILLGKIAGTIDSLIPHVSVEKIYAEHPYNLSFITNKVILDFFRPFHLLRKG